MNSSKSRLIATMLAFFLGFFAVDLFYIGKTKLAILQLVLSCFAYAVMMFSVFIMLIPFIGWIITILLGLIALPCMLIGSVWYIVRAIITACGKATDNDGLPITEWGA